jgi:sulfate adenylyltransferase
MSYFSPVTELFLPAEEAAEARLLAAHLPGWHLTPRQLCDLELLMNGGFAPLRGFLGQADHAAVCRDMRLANGTLWPIPITLDVSEDFAAACPPGSQVALRDPEGLALAILTVTDRWVPDRAAEARAVFGTEDPTHPGVHHLRAVAGPVCLGGRVRGIQPPVHPDFRALRHSPNTLRDAFARQGWQRVVGFQTRNPLHRAHLELTRRAAMSANANLLLHPATGPTKPGDPDHFTRVRCYKAVLPRFPEATTRLSLLNLAMRMAGPREAVWHGLIRRNHGCTHFIVGRDHAGPGKDARGRDFYPPYAAQELFATHEAEIGVQMVPFRAVVYLPDSNRYCPEDEVPPGAAWQDISGTELRRLLDRGEDIPDWFSFPEVLAELRRSTPPRFRRGFTVFFTGLSGAGKSSIANALRIRLMEIGGRAVTLLDGDRVRRHLSSELGFSREDRDLNIRRIGFVAAEITRHGGIAICAQIAPYAAARAEVRAMIEPLGPFIEVHVATPLAECERRDPKGLYALARAGGIAAFTGISDPYEAPKAPQMRLLTEGRTAEDCAEQVLAALARMGLLPPDARIGNLPASELGKDHQSAG